MTEIAADPMPQSAIHTSESARARLAARYRTERVFRFLGQAAIGVSVAFLALLLTTVVIQGVPAFTYNFASLDFDLSSERLGGPDEISKADFDGIVRDAIRGEFPQVTGRTPRRLLGGLISSGAPVLLRERLVGDPSLVGSSGRVSVPVSDFADLYLKGQITGSEYRDFTSPIVLEASGDGSTYTVTADQAVFGDVLELVKQRLLADAAALRQRAEGQARSQARIQSDIVELESRLSAAEDAAESAGLTARLEQARANLDSVTAEIARLEADAADREARAGSAVSGEPMTDEDPSLLIYAADGVIRATHITATTVEGEAMLPVADPGSLVGDGWRLRILDVPESNRKFSDQEIVWTDTLVDRGEVASAFNWIFFSKGASREPEMAGVWGAVVGSTLTLVVTLALSFPLGVAAAIYLQEFAPKNRITTLIEVNINNLAAVPSIVFGLLGLAVFLNFFEFDRSAPYVGGMVLGLMTLPTIIIASRVSLGAVPPSIREAALGIGASRLQTVVHHVLPLALPGILTGTIIGMARALGETAPLLMIGMVAFIVDIPGSFSDPATVLPVQIFMWADFPEAAFQHRTSAAIIVLLGFLIVMNALAVIMRWRFERRW